MLSLIGVIRRNGTVDECDGAPTPAGRLRSGDIVLETGRSYRVISTSFAGETPDTGFVVADAVDVASGRLRVLHYPSTDTTVTVQAA
ncbi:hypothetical protein BOX37_15520 [Nocardia mangyaensis]|uniref:Uncharacterized protein n=1 Tax=Nocardia mangyaensis TaxID=2213200 RepID=A0A1J0VSY2_9NOCA|nr:hypothetical protein [Nocardia mangyaensis]APE35122.1 hypothetical protein BOX37_15520 [Nocardia mangyaensis]